MFGIAVQPDDVNSGPQRCAIFWSVGVVSFVFLFEVSITMPVLFDGRSVAASYLADKGVSSRIGRSAGLPPSYLCWILSLAYRYPESTSEGHQDSLPQGLKAYRGRIQRLPESECLTRKLSRNERPLVRTAGVHGQLRQRPSAN